MQLNKLRHMNVERIRVHSSNNVRSETKSLSSRGLLWRWSTGLRVKERLKLSWIACPLLCVFVGCIGDQARDVTIHTQPRCAMLWYILLKVYW